MHIPTLIPHEIGHNIGVMSISGACVSGRVFNQFI